VVFLGDSVTVGTPPSLSSQYYRTILADALASKFGLNAPDFFWQTIDVFNGTSLTQESGDFASCAKWGARTDDLIQDSTQIADCFSQSDLQKRTLVVMTMGGNDLASLTKAATDGATQPELWAQVQGFVDLMRDAATWFREPGRFPNGVFLVFANMYEFTDGTGEVQSCDVSGLAGFDEPVPSPQELADLVIWANEQYLSIAVETQSDMIFLLEDFCGHGFKADDPAAPCYRGPNTDTWFDLTCIHPNPTGHQHIADMFMAVVNE
jgi:lysophospholipase L1-like esterase